MATRYLSIRLMLKRQDFDVTTSDACSFTKQSTRVGHRVPLKIIDPDLLPPVACKWVQGIGNMGVDPGIKQEAAGEQFEAEIMDMRVSGFEFTIDADGC